MAEPFHITLTGLDAVSARLAELGRQAPLAIARGLNRTITMVQTQVLRGLAADTALAQRDIRRAIAVKRATRADPEARLVLTGKRIPLLAFHARQTRRGVTYRLPSGRGLIPSGFLATMRSGHRGVFARRVPSRSRAGRPRSSPGLPIVEQFGPSLPHVFVKARIFEALQAKAEADLVQNIDHEIAFLLSRRAAAAEGA